MQRLLGRLGGLYFSISAISFLPGGHSRTIRYKSERTPAGVQPCGTGWRGSNMNAKSLSLIAGVALLGMWSNGTALAATVPASFFSNGSLCAGANFDSCTSFNSVNFPAQTQYSYTSPPNSTHPGTAT